MTLNDIDNDNNLQLQKGMAVLSKLYKSNEDRIFLGVLGGIAEHLEVDSKWVRLIYVLLSLGSVGLSVIIYYILAYVMLSKSYWK